METSMKNHPKLDKYIVLMKLTVYGESPEDALDYANIAIDASDLLSQDGVVGIEIDNDIDTVETLEEYNYGTYGESEEDC
jgi:hypothetical protein